MIEIYSLTKSFSTPENEILKLFENMNLRFETWDFVALMWPSGQWKTTFLNMLSGLESDYTGSIQIADTKLESLTESQRTAFRGKHISYVFQDYNLIDTLTVEENIDLVLDINHTKRRYSTDEILTKVWLLSKKKSFPNQLSWGEKQRVALARAFVSVTDIILADEPTGSLDEKNEKKVMELFQTLWKESGVTLVMITHSETVASYAANKYILADHTFKKL